MMMKYVFSFVLLGLGAAALGGCPIYSDDDRVSRACVGGGCEDAVCSSASDCPAGYGCSSDNRCRPVSGGTGSSSCSKPSDCASGNCGADHQCHPGNCSTTGCPTNFVCKLSGGVAMCEAVGTGNEGVASLCKSDSDCPTPAGSKCLSGSCVAPQDQCVDATQCPNGTPCVDGACTPACSASKPCPTGYACDAKGFCTGNAGSCTSSTQCAGGKACVQQHCVDACWPGGACGVGLVCVDGGCTPDQKPAFTCVTDGQRDKCQDGSICLRHSCYIACDADAGPDACKNADSFNVCKSVTTSSGAHSVCGSATNLGSECSPTTSCASAQVCIDGFCK